MLVGEIGAVVVSSEGDHGEVSFSSDCKKARSGGAMVKRYWNHGMLDLDRNICSGCLIVGVAVWFSYAFPG